MSKRKSIYSVRKKAFLNQGGLCFYCKTPMWEEDPEPFSKSYNLSRKQANLLQCTGEHLVPHSEQGGDTEANIVAACSYCNLKRHKAKFPKSPDEYRVYVLKRIQKGKWHQIAPLVPGLALKS